MNMSVRHALVVLGEALLLVAAFTVMMFGAVVLGGALGYAVGGVI